MVREGGCLVRGIMPPHHHCDLSYASHRPNEPLYTHHPHTRTLSPTSRPPTHRGRAVGPPMTDSPGRKGQLGGNVHVRVMNKHAIVCIVNVISYGGEVCLRVSRFAFRNTVSYLDRSLSLSLLLNPLPPLRGRPRRVQQSPIPPRQRTKLPNPPAVGRRGSRRVGSH